MKDEPFLRLCPFTQLQLRCKGSLNTKLIHSVNQLDLVIFYAARIILKFGINYRILIELKQLNDWLIVMIY